MTALETEDTFLKENVFSPVAERIIDRADSLMYLSRFYCVGIEGWLKVEAVRALGNHVVRLQNQGPDLELIDSFFVELKAATDCNPSWFLDPLKKHENNPEYPKLACLFLGSGRNISTCMERLERESRVIDSKRFSVGEHEWIVGLVAAKRDD